MKAFVAANFLKRKGDRKVLTWAKKDQVVQRGVHVLIYLETQKPSHCVISLVFHVEGTGLVYQVAIAGKELSAAKDQCHSNQYPGGLLFRH